MVGILPTKTLPVVPSTEIHSPSLTTMSPTVMLAFFQIDLDRGSADHAGDAELAGNHGGVRGGAAFAGQHTLGGDHAVHIIRLGEGAHHDDCSASASLAIFSAVSASK